MVSLSVIQRIPIEEEMKRSYLDYAMSVIVGRALPDVRDGLKPVHRRILYAMSESGNISDKPYRKSANAVGYVMMRYHPHGNTPIYEALARMAQSFSMRVPLVEGQGNFGSVDGDRPAAERYTEVRLAKASNFLLDDIDKDTVGFRPNYDNTSEEPTVLPARFPNLLINGSGGIAVGMATNIPPYNLMEVIDACCAYIDDESLTSDDLLGFIKGPDFPTGGVVIGRQGIVGAVKTGRGTLVLRGRAHFEEISKNCQAVVITEIPYQVNKASLVKQIADFVSKKIIDGVSAVLDESDRDGMRVVVELRPGLSPGPVLNQLYKHTSLQTFFSVNSVAIENGQPKILSLLEIIKIFIAFREEVIMRRVKFDLDKDSQRAHILAGLAIFTANIDKITAMIRSSADLGDGIERLTKEKWVLGPITPILQRLPEFSRCTGDKGYSLSDKQASAILALRLQRLTGLEQRKIFGELDEIATRIKNDLEILTSRKKVYEILRCELIHVKDNLATPRRTVIEDSSYDLSPKDLVQLESIFVIISKRGYIKRVPLSSYRLQKRGGRGRSSTSVYDDDSVSCIFVAGTHDSIVFFSSDGRAFTLDIYLLPQCEDQSFGNPLISFLRLSPGEAILTAMVLPSGCSKTDNVEAVFATSRGMVRRGSIGNFLRAKASGKIAMSLKEGDKIVSVIVCSKACDLLLTTKMGKIIRFPVGLLRVFSSRSSRGVRGIRLSQGDEVVSMSSFIENRQVDSLSESREGWTPMSSFSGDKKEQVQSVRQHFQKEQFVLTLSEAGFGKRSAVQKYRTTRKGGSGVLSMKVTQKTGFVVSSVLVSENDHVALTTNKGRVYRCAAVDARVANRNTQGVIILRLVKGERVSSVVLVRNQLLMADSH